MKKVISIVTLLAIVLSFAACGGVTKKSISGTWEGSTEVLFVEAKYRYIFNEDGTGTVTAPGIGVGLAMTYTLEKDVLSITTTMVGISNTEVYTVALEKDTLTLTKGDSVITLTRAAK